jgi:class 3 adenylate cyclase
VTARPAARGAITRLVLLGNLLGGSLAYFYFRFVDFGTDRLSGGRAFADVAYSVLVFAVIGVIGIAVGRRWARPLSTRRGTAARAAATEGLVRRRALLFPYAMAGVTLVGWVLAGLAWGVFLPVAFDRFVSVPEALRSMFGITVIAGSVTTAFIFFSVEHLWRRELPAFFPLGDLSAVTSVARLRVRTRLVVIFLLVSIVPLALLGVLCYTRAAALLEADPVTGAALLDSMQVFIAFILLVGGLTAVGLSVFVSRSVAAPLRELEAAMGEVERGNLDARCTVVGNDEIGAVSEGFNRMLEGLREREHIRETFGKYVTREIRDEILAGRVALEGQTREVTILFSDLRDFTSWVEAHDPREVVRDLNAYFTTMEAAIRAQGGLVLQFIGDEIEAVFGAPVADPRHAPMAVAAALDMRRRLAAWNAERRAGVPVLRHGIGIHTGKVLAGNIGSPDRLSYALVGDAVNLASRIQSLTKELGADILVSGATARRLDTTVPLEPLPAVTVKGKAAAVEVYRLGDEPSPPEATSA